MAKPEIAMIAKLLDNETDQVKKAFVVHEVFESDPAVRAAKLKALTGTIRGLVTNGGLGADRAAIDALPSLEIISCNGVGFDAIDRVECARRNIAVTNTPDVLTADVADVALGLMLSSAVCLCPQLNL
jgi:lactate dehydrogenase-like 2-hydroxyacid dehydrogenase